MHIFNKHSTVNNKILKIIAVLLLITLPFLGFYLGYSLNIQNNQKLIEDSFQPVIPSKIDTDQEYELFPTKNGNLLVYKGTKRFTALLPNEWNANTQYGSLEIIKDEYKIKITADSIRIGLCLYPQDPLYIQENDHPWAYPIFNNYQEITNENVVFRRGKAMNDKSTEGLPVEKETICQKGEDNMFRDYGIFGHISYEYSYEGSQPNFSVLQEMDTIVQSLTVMND
ncbi:MAG TPA: hypothetical protein PLS49_05640 [Candidatus Woesebacteria bacterium]|nr:hypothetical protein [Candidatus Woesebacteria bacterium]